MKTLKACITSVIIAGSLATASLASAQTMTTTTSTTSAGTVSSFTPDALVIRSTTSTTPVTYSYTKTTTYVDENGNPVSMETVKSGAPVTVYYTQDGDRMVASKVVVSHSTTDSAGNVIEQKKSTTTTTTTPNP